MKNKLFSLLFTTCGFLAAQAQVYLEPRVSYLALGGTPDIGDIGAEIGTNRSGPAVSLALGYEFNQRLSVEVRYTHLGKFTIFKESPTWQIFPTDGDLTLPAVRRYDLVQRTELFTAAARFKVWSGEKLSLALTPLLSVETSEIQLLEAGMFPGLPNVSLMPNGTVLHRRSTTDLQPGAEVALGYRLSESTRASLHYTYSPLSTADAHLLGAGLEFKF